MHNKKPARVSLLVLAAAVILLLIPGCDDHDSVAGPDDEIIYAPVTNYIRDWGYSPGRIIDLGLPEDFDGENDTILTLNVFRQPYNHVPEIVIGDSAVLYALPDDTTLHPEEKQAITVEEYDPAYYTYSPTKHYVLFKSLIGESTDMRATGVYMIIKRGDGTTDTVGNITETPYRLKMLKHQNPVPEYRSFRYMWRNVYSLRYFYFDLDSFKINIYKGFPGSEDNPGNPDNQSGVPYIQILGLDQYDADGYPNPDGIIDMYNSLIFDPENRLLIFPSRTPFDTDTSFVGTTLNDRVAQIYDYTYGDMEAQSNSKYYIQVEMKIPVEDLIGDITFNGIPYEIADAVLFSKYFVYGMMTFGKEPYYQFLATDINEDGVPGTLTDFVWLNRIIIGDLNIVPSGPKEDIQVSRFYNIINVDKPVSAVLMKFEGQHTIYLETNADEFDMLVHFDSVNTNVLLFTVGELEEVSGDLLQCDGPLVYFEAVDAYGRKYRPIIAKE